MYGLGNPVRNVDPSGHCPAPSGEYAEANIICLAGFIPTATSTGWPPQLGDPVYFKSDDRGFSSNSPKDASRFWMWIDADTGSIVGQAINPTQRATGPNGTPVGPEYPARSEPWDTTFENLFRGYNSIKPKFGDDGSITISYNIVCSDPLCNNIMAPNGSITFRPNSSGSFDVSGNVNPFPNLEAYHWNNGELQNNSLMQIENFSKNARESGHAGWSHSFQMSMTDRFRSSGGKTVHDLVIDGQLITINE